MVEVRRDLYMDETTGARHAHFAAVAAHLRGCLRAALAEVVGDEIPEDLRDFILQDMHYPGRRCCLPPAWLEQDWGAYREGQRKLVSV
jgi:hypothetical protein